MPDLQALKAILDVNHPTTNIPFDADPIVALQQLEAKNVDRNLSSISGDVTFSSSDTTEFAELSDSKKNQWLSFCGRDSIDPFGTANVEFVKWVFGAGSQTVTNLAAVRKEQVSVLTSNGIGSVKVQHVIDARALV